MKKRFYVLSCVFMLVMNIQAQVNTIKPEIKHLIGCWNNSESKEWKYGFFEKFAVYDHDFWEYQSIDIRKNKATILLKKGKESLQLKLAFKGKADSICTITSSKEGKNQFIRYSKAPDFTTEDHRTFKDNNYQTDSVTIIGYLRNVDREKPFEVSIPNIFSERGDSYHSDIDSLGRFRITVPITNTSEAYLDWQPEGILINTVLEPGETFFLYHDYSTHDTRFMGINARFHQEFRNYKTDAAIVQWKKSLSYNAKMEHDTYLLEQQKLYNEQKELFGQYLKEHPSVSDRFRLFTADQMLMSHACFLMQRRFMLRTSNKEQFSKTYMDYVHQLYSQVPQPYTLCRDTYNFLEDYFDYFNRIYANNTTSGQIELLKYLDHEKKYPLTDQQKADMADYEKGFAIMIEAYSNKVDSLTMVTKVKPYRKGMNNTGVLLLDNNVMRLIKEFEPLIPSLLEKKFIRDNFLCFDSISAPPFLRETITAKAFYQQLYQEQKALDERNIDYLKTLVHDERLRKIVLEQQNTYALLDKQEMEDTESLKNTDHLKDVTDAGQLFSQLITPYKGKVIYIDFWGTWCSPCKEMMQYTPALKTAMKDKDVIFMYFANRSPEQSWKNVIKENHLIGTNVVHYNLPAEQEDLLEKHLSIRQFPTFILIDKQGNIVDTQAPFPNQKELLINRLNELLAK